MFNNDIERTKRLIIRAIIASTNKEAKEVFVEQEIRRMVCEWCELGIPVDANGNHVLHGLTIPCEYEEKGLNHVES